MPGKSKVAANLASKSKKAMNTKSYASKSLPDFPILITERLVLRDTRVEDLDATYAALSDPRIPKYMAFPPYKRKKDLQSHFKTVIRANYLKGDYSRFAIVSKRTGKWIGSLGYRIPSYQAHCANFGFLLDRKYWGKGYMAEAVQAIIKHCFEDLSLERLEATCDLENMASAKVMEKCGMMREGIMRSGYYSWVLNEYRDVYLYAIVRSDYESKTENK